MNILKENLLRKIIRNEIKSILNENEQPLTEMASRYIVTKPEEFNEKYEEVKNRFKEGSTMRTILDKLSKEGEVDYNKLKVELNKSDIASFNNPNTRKYLEGQGLDEKEKNLDFSGFLKPQGKAREKSAGESSMSKVEKAAKAFSGLSAEEKAEMMKFLSGGSGETNEAQEIKEFLQFKKWKNRLK
jgi:hypothetical protein